MKYLPDKTKKYPWQKKHNENLSGTNKAYKPNKISKKNRSLNLMKLGKINFIIFLYYFPEFLN